MAHAEAPAFGPAVAAPCSAIVGLTYTRVGRRLHRRAVRARPRRGGQLPGGDQDRRGVVSEARARARHRASSTRAPTSARSSTPLVVPWITLTLGLVLGVRRHRRDRVPLAGRRGGCSIDRPSSIRASARAELALHPQRSAGADRPRAVAHAAAASPDLGVRDRQVPDRSGLVALPVLDPGLPQPQSRHRPHERRAAARRDLSDRRRRQHRRRLAVVVR